MTSIQGYLDSLFGRGKFKVSFSKGHIRDLPKDSLGLTAEYTPNYVFNDSGASRVRELKALVEKSQKVYLATIRIEKVRLLHGILKRFSGLTKIMVELHFRRLQRQQ